MTDEAAPPADAPAPESAAPAAVDAAPAEGLPPSPLSAAPPADGAAPEGDKPAEGDAPAPAAADAADKVPEAYEFTPPEGVTLDKGMLTEWQEKARAAGLTQKQFAGLTQDAIGMVNAIHAQNQRAWDDTRKGWLGELATNYPDIAGATPGTLKPEAQALAAKALDALGGDALRQALAVSGVEYHPAMMNALVQVGKLLGGNPQVEAGSKAPALSDAEILSRIYPSMARQM